MPHYKAIADDWSDFEDEVEDEWEESGNERNEELGNEVGDEKDHEVEAGLDQEIAETPQLEALGKSSQVAGADIGEEPYQTNGHLQDASNRIAEGPTPARGQEGEPELGQEGIERSQQEVQGKSPHVARGNNVEDAPEIRSFHAEASNTISEEPTPSKSPRANLRVSKDAWSWSDSGSDDETTQPIVPRRPSPILISSDCEGPEPISSRKRKRPATARTHKTTSKQPKRTHASPRSRSSSLLSPNLVVSDQDPLLHTHLPHLLPPHLLSVGSVRFAGSKQGPRIDGSSDRSHGPQQPSGSQDDTPGVAPTATTCKRKEPLSTKSSAQLARHYRKRKNAIAKLFHCRYLADRSATLVMVANLQKDSSWTGLKEEERNAIRASNTQELMERRFAGGRSQSAFLSKLLQLISQRGYSEGVVLRLLLQKDSVQAVLGTILEDVVDVDEAGNVSLSKNSASFSPEQAAG